MLQLHEPMAAGLLDDQTQAEATEDAKELRSSASDRSRVKHRSTVDGLNIAHESLHAAARARDGPTHREVNDAVDDLCRHATEHVGRVGASS